MAKKKPLTHLTAQDQRAIEDASHQNGVRKLSMKLASRDVEILEVKRDLVTAQIKIAEQNRYNLSVQQNMKLQQHVKFMAELKERYGIGEADQFGFDPDTGEVSITPKG